MAFVVAGVPSTDPLWFLHAAESTAALEYPQGIPRGVAEPLAQLRRAAEDMKHYGDLVAAVLWHEGAEGVEQRTDCQG